MSVVELVVVVGMKVLFGVQCVVLDEQVLCEVRVLFHVFLS